MKIDKKKPFESTAKPQFNLQDLLDDMQTFVGILDKEGRLLFVNNSPLAIAGLEEKDVLGEYFWDCFWFNYDAEVKLSIREYCENAAQGESVLQEVLVRIRDDFVWIDFSIHPVFDELGEIIQLVPEGRLISERKLATKKLLDSERKSRVWLEHSPVCTKIVDLGFNLKYMSAAGIEALSIDDITPYYGKPYPFEFYPESFKEQMTFNMEKVKVTGDIITQEARVVDINGCNLGFHSTIVPVNDNDGKLEYIIIVSIDTTKRMNAENELRLLNKELELRITQRTLELL